VTEARTILSDIDRKYLDRLRRRERQARMTGVLCLGFAALLIGASISMRLLFAQLWPGVAENLGTSGLPALLDSLVDIKVGERGLLVLGLALGFLGFRELWGSRLLITLAEELEGRREVR
jgi:hypothetical protein